MSMNAVAENRLLARWAALAGRGGGEVHAADCELLPLGGGELLAVKVDAIVEEVDAGLYHEPRTVGRLAVTATLSDLAAVGAEPLGVLLDVDLPRDRAEAAQAEIAAGAREACEAAGVAIWGGDTSVTDRVRVACVGVGRVPEGVVRRRIGLAPGDMLVASGPLGAGAAFAARARLLGGGDESHWSPPSRVRVGLAARGLAHAAMDTSDGLIATLDQLARLNEVAVRLPTALGGLLCADAAALRAALGLPAFPFLAADHGEFEVIFATRDPSPLAAAIRAGGGEPVEVGVVEPGAGLWVGGQPVDGARVRGLLAEVGGDAGRYLAALVGMGLP